MLPLWGQLVQVEPGPYVGQLALLPTGAAAAALAAGSAAATAALAGLPVSGSSVAAGLAKRLTEEQFEQTLQASGSQAAGPRVRVPSMGCAMHLAF